MAASSLKRYFQATFTAATWTAVMGAVVPATRALVVSKVCVSNPNVSTAVTFSLGISSAANNGGKFADNVVLQGGQVYTETGIIIETGQQLNAYSSTTNGIQVTCFGEEVDN